MRASDWGRSQKTPNWRARSRRKAAKTQRNVIGIVGDALERNSGRKAVREGKPLALALQTAYRNTTGVKHAEVAA